MPSVRAAMISICLSRGRLFMTGPVRMLWTDPETLEKQLQLLYISRNGHLPRVQSGVVIGDRRRSNGDGPAKFDPGSPAAIRTRTSPPVTASVLLLAYGAKFEANC